MPVLIVFFLSWGMYGNEWGGVVWQGIVDPMVALVLLAALVVLGLSAVALFRPHSPVPAGLCLLAASVGLLAQFYIILDSFINAGATLITLPQLFSLLASGLLLWSLWLPLLGFLLSGGAMALAALKAEQRLREREEGGLSSQEEVDEQENVWGIGKRHILAMIVGVLLYSVLSNLSIFWEGPGEGNFERVFPAAVLVLFFGVVYGPWVGLVTGGIGSFLNNVISTLAHAPYWMLTNYGTLNSFPLDTSHPHVYWPLVAGNALIGFMAGLPLFGTTRRNKTVHSLLAVMLRSALSIVVGISLMVILYDIGQPVAMTLLDIQSSFTYEIVPTLLVVVLLLPLLLVLAPVRTTRRRESQTFS